MTAVDEEQFRGTVLGVFSRLLLANLEEETIGQEGHIEPTLERSQT